MAKIRLRFNQYKSNIKLNVEGRRGFKAEKLIQHFFLCNHNGAREDIKVQVIGHCDPNDQEATHTHTHTHPHTHTHTHTET